MDLDIGTLSHRQLQDECMKANLSASGSTKVLRRRLRGLMLSRTSNGSQEAAPPKRQKSVTDDLICAITHELPFDPVTAEDGRVYERSAMEQHIQSQQGRTLKSPVTNEPMGTRLLPAPQTKSLIETLIETRAITGDLSDTWKKKEKEKKKAEDLLKKADDGDADSMHIVYRYYKHGKFGFKKDCELAYQWVKKAHAAGSVKATSALGNVLTKGMLGDFHIPKNNVEGMVLIALAAEKGSDLAAYRLGLAFASGSCGLSVDTARAIFWLQKSLSGDCPHHHLSQYSREQTREKLEELRNGAGETSDDE